MSIKKKKKARERDFQKFKISTFRKSYDDKPNNHIFAKTNSQKGSEIKPMPGSSSRKN